MQGTIFRLCELKHDWRNLKNVTFYDNVEQGLLKNLGMIFFNQEKKVSKLKSSLNNLFIWQHCDVSQA